MPLMHNIAPFIQHYRAIQYIFQNFLSLVAIIRAKYEQTLHYACNKLSNIQMYVGQILFHFVVETHHCLLEIDIKYNIFQFITMA